MPKNVLIVHAQPEPTSLTRQFAEVAIATLERQGFVVSTSDLYGMRWKAVFDDSDFPDRANTQRLSFIQESGHAFQQKRQATDVAAEQEKVMAADAVIFHFPLWWYGMPAIMKGWFDRVWAHGLAYGYQGAGNCHRYGDGAFKGKRALLCVSIGGPAVEYGPLGINGPLDELLFPITHGCLYFPGFDVLPTFATFDADRLAAAEVEAIKVAWADRVRHLFDSQPIPFRPQNGGAYDAAHVLRPALAKRKTGVRVHWADPES